MKIGNDITVDDGLIVRYLCGEATPGEAMALHDWLEDAGNAHYFEKMETTWHAAYPAKRPRGVRAASGWEALRHKTDNIAPPATRKASRFKPAYFTRVAAALLLLVVSGAIIFITTREAEEINVNSALSLQHVGFDDRSTATLSRNTRLSYPAYFSGSSREVRLVSGEAFFSITPNRSKPFIIHTAVADIKVVGTSFNVVAGNDHLEVSVSEGKVLVYNDSDSLYLAAGFRGSIKPGLRSFGVPAPTDANAWGYATHQFTFKDTPLYDIIRDIEKAYPCTIALTGTNIGNCRLTANFDNDSAEKILNLIAETLNLTLTQNGSIFSLEGEGCP